MKPKIPKLTKKERRIWIKALKEVLDKYKKTGEPSDHCLCSLCSVCGDCWDCIWVYFTGMFCAIYYKKHFKKCRLGFRSSRWVKLRLRQIPRWIKKLEEEL